MKKHSVAALLLTLAFAALPATLAPAAHADVCGDVGGPNVNVNGCLPPGAVQEGAAALGGIAVADAWDEARQRVEGRPPCYTPQGVPYYTLGDAPCL
jgi:hypothetical protein